MWPCWSSLFRIIPGNTQARTVRIIVRPRANPGKGSRQGLEALPWRYIFGRSSGHGSRLVTQTSLWIISSDASLDTPGFLDFYFLLVFLSLVGIDGTDRVICRELEKKKKTRVSYSWIIFTIFSRIFSNSYEYWLKFIFFFFNLQFSNWIDEINISENKNKAPHFFIPLILALNNFTLVYVVPNRAGKQVVKTTSATFNKPPVRYLDSVL